LRFAHLITNPNPLIPDPCISPLALGLIPEACSYFDSAFRAATVPIDTVVAVVSRSGPAAAPLDWRMYAVIDV